MSFDRSTIYLFTADGRARLTCTVCKEKTSHEVGSATGYSMDALERATVAHEIYHAEQDVSQSSEAQSTPTDAVEGLRNDLTAILAEVAAEVQPKVQKALADFVQRSGFKGFPGFPF